MQHSSTLSKGDWVHAAWFEPSDAYLPGKLQQVQGIITHIQGEAPHQTNIWVKPGDGSAEVILRPEWIKARKPAVR